MSASGWAAAAVPDRVASSTSPRGGVLVVVSLSFTLLLVVVSVFCLGFGGDDLSASTVLLVPAPLLGSLPSVVFALEAAASPESGEVFSMVSTGFA